MYFDLAPTGTLQFEDLAGLFASTSLDHGVIAMTVRQTAYLFGLVRRMKARRVIEIGRYKGLHAHHRCRHERGGDILVD